MTLGSISYKNGIVEIGSILGLIAASSYIFFPGGMSGDSVDQWRQVLHIDQVNNFSPPAMVYVWWLTYQLIHHSGGMIVFHFSLYWLSLLFFSHVFYNRLLSRIAFMLIVGFFPVIFIMNGTIWKDVSMLSSLSLAVSLLFMYSKSRSVMFLVAGFLFLIYGLSVRYNAIFSSFPIIYYLVTQTSKSACKEVEGKIVSEMPSTRQRGYLLSTLLIMCFFGIVQFINKYKVHDNKNISNSVFIWDLWGMSVLTGKNLLPAYLFKEDKASEINFAFLKKNYKPYTNSVIWIYTYLRDDKWESSFPDRRFKMDFLRAVVSHPLAYLKVRLRLFYYLCGLKEGFLYFPHYIKIARFPRNHYLRPYSKDISMKNPAIIGFIQKIASYVHLNTILYSTWIYAVLSVVFIFLSSKIKQYKIEIITLLLSGLMYWLPLLILAPGAEFRYNNWLIFTTVLTIPLIMKSFYYEYMK